MTERLLGVAVRDRRIAVFAGAGVVRDAGLPSWAGLVEAVSKDLEQSGHLSEPVVQAIRLLATTNNDLASAFDIMLGQVERRFVAASMRSLLSNPGESETIAVLRRWHFPGLVTTNFDRLTESAAPVERYRLDNSESSLKLLPTAAGAGANFCSKIHGDIDNELGPADPLVAGGGPFMVLSQADFAALVQGDRGRKIIHGLHSILQTYPVLFLGYSLADPDIAWILRYLSDNCQFVHPSWYVHLRGEVPPALPSNVQALAAVDSWTDLPAWLDEIRQPPASPARRADVPPGPSPATVRAYATLSRYLRDLESPDLTDRVVGSVLFEVVCDRSVATYAELADVTQNLLGVGLRLADGLARSAVRLLVEHGVVHTAGDRVSVIVAAAQALETSSTATLTRERERFFQSAIRRLPSGSQLVAGPEGQKPIDAILLSVSSDLGESMAQWVSLGVGSPVSLAGLNSRIREEISNDEEARQAEALLRLILSDPTDDEIPYLYRLLGATFLANTVRLDPIAAAQLNQSMGAYELYLDANVVLPLLVEEHPHHATTRSVVQESIGLGVQLAVLTPILNEVLSHREQARREFAAFRGNAAHLRELAEALGLRTNVFVQGWLGAVPSGTVGTVVEWRDYMAKYSDDSLVARLEECGVAVVEPDADTDSGPLYADALTEIRNAWLLRQGRDRDDILNVHEAVQVCHIHLRRGNSPENRDHIWFLSNETVLQKVFERRPAKWGLPPTFPYSAWAAFLDTRLPFVSKDPRSIVVAITRTQTEAFGLPNPAALVRRRAFGDRVTSRAEEEALEYALSDHNLMLRVETAQRDVVRRGREPGAAKDLAEAQNAAVAEISNALDAQMTRLNDALGRREQDLQAARARIKELETARDHPPRQGEPQRRRRRHSGGKGPTR